MTEDSTTEPDTAPLPPTIAFVRRMGGRKTDEAHRASSPLEALFDLTTVVAVYFASVQLHNGWVDGHPVNALITFVLSFLFIWWPWMGFTWLSSAYDTDDVPYRFAVFAQMIGVLLVASGLPETGSVSMAGVIGYGVSRLAVVSLWLRAAANDAKRRDTCRRYAVGVGVLQILWLARAVWVPAEWLLPAFLVLMLLEFAVPVWAEKKGETPWHPHHIAERYGLFTLILLGECMLGSAESMQIVLAEKGLSLDLAVVSIALVGLILGLWWVYFLVPFAQVLHLRRERAFGWGYGHAVVFAALAFLGGSLEIIAEAFEADGGQGATEDIANIAITATTAIGLTAIAVCVCISGLWGLGVATTQRRKRSPIYLLPTFAVSGFAVGFVAFGGPLSWGLLLLACGPALLIGWIMRLRTQRPEDFAVR